MSPFLLSVVLPLLRDLECLPSAVSSESGLHFSGNVAEKSMIILLKYREKLAREKTFDTCSFIPLLFFFFFNDDDDYYYLLKLVLLYEGVVLRLLALCFVNSKLTFPFQLFQFSFKICTRYSLSFLKLFSFLQSAERNIWGLYENGFWPPECFIQQVTHGKQNLAANLSIRSLKIPLSFIVYFILPTDVSSRHK